jgi:AcrR family transcriptional regulator
MLDRIAERFAARARTPKGSRTLRAIFAATRELVSRDGVENVSLDAIADRAGLTQAALRHYFPTRHDLLTAFFLSATAWFRDEVESMLRSTALARAQQRLEDCVTWHLEYMEQVDAVVWLESSAFWLRDAGSRRLRDDFYAWLTAQYAALIRQACPDLAAVDCERRALATLTMVLGAWITHGRGSPVGRNIPTRERRQYLVGRIMQIATG